MEAAFNDTRKILLEDYKTFTGEAKPNVIRLLPSLHISDKEIDLFLKNLQSSIHQISNTHS